MSQALLPVLTLVLGNLLGYLFAVRQIRRRVAAEKRVEFAARFVAYAYENLGYLIKGKQNEAATRMAEFSILGQQTGFFVTDGAAKAIDDLTAQFASGVLYLGVASQGITMPGSPRDVWGEYKKQLEAVRVALQKEVEAHK